MQIETAIKTNRYNIYTYKSIYKYINIYNIHAAATKEK